MKRHDGTLTVGLTRVKHGLALTGVACLLAAASYELVLALPSWPGSRSGSRIERRPWRLRSCCSCCS